jgi:hypothetical protein
MSDGISKIVQRFGGAAREGLITETFRFLERSTRDSGMAEGSYQTKERETEDIIDYCNEHKLWFDLNLFSVYLDEGAEQKVFILDEQKKVIKLNDAIFYVNWTQYLESLIIHNLLFSPTSYELKGFIRINDILYAVVEQDYIESSEQTSLENIRNKMFENGFVIKKKNDFIHNELGLIIEDLHEENVLTFKGILFFIDTVIYLKN